MELNNSVGIEINKLTMTALTLKQKSLQSLKQ